MACDLVNKIMIDLLSNKGSVTKLKKNIDAIKNFDRQIETAMKAEKVNPAQIARYKELRVATEANIVYAGIYKSLSDVVNKKGFDINVNIDDFVDVLKKAFPSDYEKYLDKLKEVDGYTKLVDGVKNSDIIHSIAFDAALYHKYNGFKPLEKGASEYLAKNLGGYGISDGSYDIYRDIVKTVASNGTIDEKEILKKMKSISDIKDNGIIKNAGDVKKLLNSATSIADIEDVFLLGFKHIDGVLLDSILDKIDSLKFIGENKGNIKSFMEVMGNPIFNYRVAIKEGHYKKMIERVKFSGLELTTDSLNYIKNNRSAFVSDVADLLDNGKPITIGDKKFTIDDKDFLVGLVGDELLEAEYASRGYRSYKYIDLQNLTKSSDQITIKPDVVKVETQFDNISPIPKKTAYDYELVSIDELDKFKQQDRLLEPKFEHGEVKKLAEKIKKDGYIKEPLIITYYQNGRLATLGEGNTRLAAAKMLGMNELPVRVVRVEKSIPLKSEKVVKVKGVNPDINGYVKGDLLPSEIGLKANVVDDTAKNTTPREQYGNTILTYMNNGYAKNIDECIVIDYNVFKGQDLKDDYSKYGALNSLSIGTPKAVITPRDENELFAEIKKLVDNSKEEPVNIILRDNRVFNKIQNLYTKNTHPNVDFIYPKGGTLFYVDEAGDMSLGFVASDVKRDLVDLANKQGIELPISREMIMPDGAIENILDKDFQGQGFEKIGDIFGIYRDDIDFTDLAFYLRFMQSTDGRFLPSVVDYGVEWLDIVAKADDYFIEEANKLSLGDKIITDKKGLNFDKIRDDYFNYKFAKDFANKEYAQYVFLKNFKLSPGDVVTNLRKKTALGQILRSEFSMNVEGFNEFVSLLSREGVTEDMIKNDLFIKNVLGRNSDNVKAQDAVGFFDYVRGDIVPKLDETIPGRDEVKNPKIDSEIILPKEGKGVGLIDNRMNIEIDSNIIEVTGDKLFRISDEATIGLDGIRTARQEALEAQKNIDIGDYYNQIGDIFNGEADRLFDEYNKLVRNIIEKGGDNADTELRKVHGAFIYGLVKLDSDVLFHLKQSSKTYMSIEIPRVGMDIDVYIGNTNSQRDILKTFFNSNVDDILQANATDGILRNGDVIKNGMIIDGSEYARLLTKKNGQEQSIELIRSFNNNELKKFIKQQEQLLDQTIKEKGIVYSIYNMFSDGLRNSKFLDEYRLVDDMSGYKIPEKFVDFNPSIYSKSVALSMMDNQVLIKNIFDRISETYLEDGYFLGGKVIKMGTDVKENLIGIEAIIRDEITNSVASVFTRLGEEGAAGVSADLLFKPYMDAFTPYADFVKLPQSVVNKVSEKQGVAALNVGDYMKQYIGKQSADLNFADIAIDEGSDVFKRINNIVDNYEDLVSKTFRDSYLDVTNGGLSDFLMPVTQDILTRDSEAGRFLMRLFREGKTDGLIFGAWLYKIVPENYMFGIDLTKEGSKLKPGNWKKFIYNFDMDLLYKAQDTFKEIRAKGLRGQRLDDWFVKNNQTHHGVAYHAVKYFDNYHNTLGKLLPKDVLTKLEDTFLLVGRDKEGAIIDFSAITTEKGKELKKAMWKEVGALASMAKNNSFLGVFNLGNAPDTPLKKMNYKLFDDGSFGLEGGLKANKGFYEEFNKFFGTNLSEDNFKRVYQSIFGGRVIQFNKYIEGIASGYRYAKRILFNPIIRMPVVFGLNILSGFSTGIVSGLTRGIYLTKGITELEREGLIELITKYNLLEEYADLSKTGLKQILSEANRLGGGNFVKGLGRALKTGSLGRSFELVTSNANNFMDLALMGNYKIYAIDQAIKGLSGRKFVDPQDLIRFLENADDVTRADVLSELKALSNRGFYSVVAVTDGNMDKVVPGVLGGKLFGHQLAAAYSIARPFITFMNGWGDGIIRGFGRGVLNSIDFGLYLAKNGVNKQTLGNIAEYIKKTPEYVQFVKTLQADIWTLAKAIRVQRTYEDIYEDGDGITIDDLADSFFVTTTIGNGLSASLVGQTWFRSFEQANQIMEANIGEGKDYSRMQAWGNSFTSTIFSRFMVELKYLKPRENAVILAKRKVRDDPELSFREALFDSLGIMVSQAGGNMLKYLIQDSFDPDNLTVDFEERKGLPDVLGADLTDDAKQAYNSKVNRLIEISSLGDWSSYISQLYKGSMINSAIVSPFKAIFGEKIGEQEFVKESKKNDMLKTFLNKGEVQADITDINSIKTYVFVDTLVNETAMLDWLGNRTIKDGSAYLNDAVGLVYDKLGEDAVRKLYENIASQKGDKKKLVAKQTILNQMIDFANSGVFEGETEDLVKSIIAHTQYSMMVENNAPKTNDFDKGQYLIEQFNEGYKWMMENNVDIVIDFVGNKFNRENQDFGLSILDNDGKLKGMYKEYFRNELLLKKAIDNSDFDYIKSYYNPLVKSARFDTWNLIKEDKTIDEVNLALLNRTANYIKATAGRRGEGETAEMLSAIVQADLDGFIDGYRNGAKYGIGLSEGMKNFIENVFYAESIMSDYIMNSQNGSANIISGGSGIDLPSLKDNFKNISTKFDKIRSDFKGGIKAEKFDQVEFKINKAKQTIFDKKSIPSYQGFAAKSIFTDGEGKKTKDITRKIKPSKDFKFKE